MATIKTILQKIGIGREKEPPQPDKSSSEIPDTTPRQGYYAWLNSTDPSLTVATVYRCVKLLSDSVAQLPLHYKKRKGDIFVADLDGDLHYLLNVQPNMEMTAFDFWALAVQQVLLFGNAYIVPHITIEGNVDRLTLCNPECVQHDYLTSSYTVQDPENGISGKFGELDIIHLKGMVKGPDYNVGLSVISFARTTLGIARTGDDETLKRFENGGSVKGILSGPGLTQGLGPYQQKEMRNLAKKTSDELSEYGISGHNGDVKFQQIAQTSADMQFLQSRSFAVRDICRFFGVHPSFVFDDTSNNYKSAEMANVAFLSNTLNPLLRKIEAELLRKLIHPKDAKRRRFEFDRSSLYACDLDSRITYLTKRIGAGLGTVNEIRRMENLPPIEGGDKVLVSANLKTLDELSQPQKPQPQNQEPQDGNAET